MIVEFGKLVGIGLLSNLGFASFVTKSGDKKEEEEEEEEEENNVHAELIGEKINDKLNNTHPTNIGLDFNNPGAGRRALFLQK